MPNPDGTMTAAERQQALLATAKPLAGTPGSGTQFKTDNTFLGHQFQNQVATGQILGGSDAEKSNLQGQSELFANLSGAEQAAKQQGDFGLGTNNNAATSAMLGNAMATGDKYSGQFGGDAAAAGAASAAAAGRGVAGYMGNTAPWASGVGNAQQDRGMQTGAYGQLMNFANQGIPGPSAAEAQLTQATDSNTQNALAMARSGRGMGGSAAGLRQAMAQNAVTQQQSAGQMTQLRANEDTANATYRLNAANAAGGLASQTVQGDQGTAASGLAGAQYHTSTMLQGTQLNDAASQAWAAQQQAAQQQGLGAEMGAQTQGLNINASALAGRESQWASANQTHGIDSGNATTAGIADANRTQAYIGAGTAAAGSVIAAASDQNAKTNIQPLSAMPGAVTALPSQSPAQAESQSAVPASKSAADAATSSAHDQAVGGTAGSVAGGVAGSAVAGPVGGFVGSALGNVAGKALGKVFSDVRNKTAIAPLSAVGRGIQSAGGQLESQKPRGAFDDLQALVSKYGASGTVDNSKAVSEYTKLRPDQEKGFASWVKKNDVRDLDNPDAHYDYRGAYAGGVGRGSSTGHFPDTYKQHGHPTFSIESQYSKNANDGGTWDGEKFSPAVAPKPADTDLLDDAYRRGGGTPILSNGDALLADSARGAPPSSYQYKDPRDGQGTYVGPMAQDLAANPVTAPAVQAGPDGKLQVDGTRASLAALSQNHSQQNQLDALYAMLDDSKKKELQRSSGGLDSAGNPYMTAGAN